MAAPAEKTALRHASRVSLNAARVAQALPAMTLDASPALPAPRPWTIIGACLVLFAVAAFELWDGLCDVRQLSDPAMRAAQSGWDGFMRDGFTVVHPLLAGAALLCAAIGRWRGAVIATAALVLLRWLTELPDLWVRGLQIVNLFSAQETMAHTVVAPLLAVCAIAFAIRGRRPVLATGFACFMTLYNVVGIVIFIAGVMRYGF
jgi:hypothetical protein